jgi:hypothetical protein
VALLYLDRLRGLKRRSYSLDSRIASKTTTGKDEDEGDDELT